jgi:hypothetical protein
MDLAAPVAMYLFFIGYVAYVVKTGTFRDRFWHLVDRSVEPDKFSATIAFYVALIALSPPTVVLTSDFHGPWMRWSLGVILAIDAILLVFAVYRARVVSKLRASVPTRSPHSFWVLAAGAALMLIVHALLPLFAEFVDSRLHLGRAR